MPDKVIRDLNVRRYELHKKMLHDPDGRLWVRMQELKDRIEIRRLEIERQKLTGGH